MTCIFDCICLRLNVQNSEVAEMVGAPDWEFPHFVLSWFHRYTNLKTVTCASHETNNSEKQRLLRDPFNFKAQPRCGLSSSVLPPLPLLLILSMFCHIPQRP